MPAPHAQHPSPQDLAAFAVGRLSGTDAGAIAAHLESCPDCRRAAEKAHGADPLVARVKAAGAPGPSDETVPPGSPRPVPAGANLPPELANHPRYRILKELGKGGMGIVYHAEQTMMDRQVAIKVISKSLLDQPGALERFEREVRAAAKLIHPNIVIAYDAERAGDLHMLVMEFVEGQSLDQVLRRKGPLPVMHACVYVRQAALGLQHAFEKGMVHRDIKPHNLMLTPKGQVKILDFGLAKMVSENRGQTALTALNSYMGTPDYSAPEQATDARKADIRADIYSLGCTLYCLLAGRPPFREETPVQTILAHLEKEPTPLPQLRPDVPAELWAVVARMLAKDPAQRYQKPAEVAQALAPFGKGGARTPPPAVAPSPGRASVTAPDTSRRPGKRETASATEPAPLVESPTKPRRRRKKRPRPAQGKRRWLLGGGVAAALLVLAAGAWLLTGVLRVKTPPDTSRQQAEQPVTPPVPVPVPAPVPGGPEAFFNGTDLTGWEGLPGYWRVESGAIVGAVPPFVPPAHTFLCSTKTYKDFDLRFQVRRKDGVGNSGVQFRSQIKDRGQFTVVGPQCEIDSAVFEYPPGSLLSEPNLQPFRHKAGADAAANYKDADFNAFHIRCVGKHVLIEVNAVTAIDGDYPQLPDEGIIAWQMHGGKPPREVTFRNIEFTDLGGSPPAGGFVSLFNGRDLTGWTKVNGQPAGWKVNGGVLEAVPKAGDIMTTWTFGPDVELHAEFRIPLMPDRHGQARGNSGIYLLGRHEIQIVDDVGNNAGGPEQCCGALYGIIGPSKHVTRPPTDWQEYDIEYHAPRFDAGGKLLQPGRLAAVFNGTKVIDAAPFTVAFTAGAALPTPGSTGPIVLQERDAPVQFRKLEIKELPAAVK